MCGQGWATGDHPRDSERSKGKARSDLVARASIDQGGGSFTEKIGGSKLWYWHFVLAPDLAK